MNQLYIYRHLLIDPDAYLLESIKLHIYWAAGFSHSILVTKIDFIETFHNRCAFSMKLA